MMKEAERRKATTGKKEAGLNHSERQAETELILKSAAESISQKKASKQPKGFQGVTGVGHL
jgi:hypothetical protein